MTICDIYQDLQFRKLIQINRYITIKIVFKKGFINLDDKMHISINENILDHLIAIIGRN